MEIYIHICQGIHTRIIYEYVNNVKHYSTFHVEILLEACHVLQYTYLGGMKSSMSVFGDWLLYHRKAKNLSMDSLATLSGVSKNYISMIERDLPDKRTGIRPRASRNVVIALARALEIPIGAVLPLAGYSIEEPTEVASLGEEKLVAYFRDLDSVQQEAVLAVAETLLKYKEKSDEQGS